MSNGDGVDPGNEQVTFESLRVLTPEQIEEKDQALDSLGPNGVLRLFIAGGRLRITPVRGDSDPIQSDRSN